MGPSVPNIRIWEYAWSLPTLSRRLNFFGIKYIRYETSVEDVKKAIQEEMEGPGQYLGYRAMQRKVGEQHKLAVPRNLVYDVMSMVDPEGMTRRGNIGQKKRQRGATGTLVLFRDSLLPHPENGSRPIFRAG